VVSFNIKISQFYTEEYISVVECYHDRIVLFDEVDPLILASHNGTINFVSRALRGQRIVVCSIPCSWLQHCQPCGKVAKVIISLQILNYVTLLEQWFWESPPHCATAAIDISTSRHVRARHELTCQMLCIDQVRIMKLGCSNIRTA
jgi:hypothetical protein